MHTGASAPIVGTRLDRLGPAYRYTMREGIVLGTVAIRRRL